ncbi:MAG: hypothetical protein K9L78_04020 [Victivallales bacterium]|nr:hypothetical protein [Victivallales bacterium]MCF7889268.1 hypothetical protein [Victivallales bacterium]
MLKKILNSIIIITILTGCCRDCLITNKELSSIEKFKNKNNMNLVKINSGRKSSEIILTENKGIKSFCIDNNNILSDIYSCGIFNTYIKTNENGIWNSLKFNPQKKQIRNKKTVIFTDNSTEYNFLNTRKITMNLNNGDIHINEKISNNNTTAVFIKQDRHITLKGNGYIILPMSILSDINNRGWEYTGKEKIKYLNKNIKTSGNYLIVHAVPGMELKTDPNSGWYVYLKNNLMFINRYSCKNRNGQRINILLKIKIINNLLHIYRNWENRKIQPNKNILTSGKWTLEKIDKNITNINEAATFFKESKLKIKVLIDR